MSEELREIGEHSSYKQFCTFHIAGRLFGVDILDVKEINSETSFTTIYHAASEIDGYVNIRGVIHLILDLAMLLGLTPTDKADTKKLVIFKPAVAPNFGVLVDGIGDVVRVAENEIDTRIKAEDYFAGQDEHKAKAMDLMNGVCKLKKQLLVILDAGKFSGKNQVMIQPQHQCQVFSHI